ncbi:MAG: hypothetical protein Q9197_002768 [Variospora fuerteventurae]
MVQLRQEKESSEAALAARLQVPEGLFADEPMNQYAAQSFPVDPLIRCYVTSNHDPSGPAIFSLLLDPSNLDVDPGKKLERANAPLLVIVVTDTSPSPPPPQPKRLIPVGGIKIGKCRD